MQAELHLLTQYELHGLSFVKKKFNLGDFSIFLSEEKNKYKVRKLSNTSNSNVIFTLEVKKEQQEEDIKCFISEIEELKR